MQKEVYLIRHGQTEYNKLGIWQGSGVDSALNEMGFEQAQRFYAFYKNAQFDQVIHSSLLRSKQTVKPFIDDGIESACSPLINEISWGRFEGKPHTKESISTYQSVIKEWSQDQYDAGFPGGESANDLNNRLSNFVSRLEAWGKQKVLVCSHGRAIRGLLCIMQGESLKEMEKYDHANTGLFRCKFNENEWIFDCMNNTDHLR